MTTILFIFYILITLASLVTLILFGTKPSKSFSWLLVIVMLPYIGCILYALFGINRRKIKFFKLKRIDEMRAYNVFRGNGNHHPVVFSSGKSAKISALIEGSIGVLPKGGNRVAILNNGVRTFTSIFEALEKAEKFIHIQFYIFEDGELMEKLFELFRKKMEEGVEIRVIYDAIGSFSLPKKHIRRFRAIGVKIFSTMPIRFGSILFTINYRNHRKIVVVDGNVGFTGGVNISDKYIRPSNYLGIWDDMHLRLEGPAVKSLHRVFVKDYFFASGGEDLWKPEYFPENTETGDTVVQIVSGGPDSDFSSVMYQYASMINQAERSICIANPYFIPNATILESLKMAALGGVRVKLLVPKKSDTSVVKYSMHSYFEELLSAGIVIYEHPVKFLHSKIIVIDDEMVSVGSGNFDNRSFDQNFEVNALVFDERVARDIREGFDRDCSGADQLDLDTFKKRSFLNKILEGIARIFSPLL
ncbi:cardiolipin synthase [Sinomicrobium oceani]|uniref:Cardiolipin synthase n=1 Tax=Sinomicrobium oceani TaxID=1150368 RepID=A0A1K1QMT9_9FLAO|nr:cardiolipin synthase [Sinomicrobium oceani]SFW60566.1 cardiolipin synthase [Sinomicrobium oceani]